MMQENQKSISLGFPTFYDLEIDRAPTVLARLFSASSCLSAG